jgi:hypothetical protein
MAQQFQIFEVIVKKRGRGWKWRVCTAQGHLVMQGSEISRPAAKYNANCALFLLLLGSPHRSKQPKLPNRPGQHFFDQPRSTR